MPRPQKRRRICSIPGHCRFGPRGEASSCTIVMTLDEYEAIRLIDLLGFLMFVGRVGPVSLALAISIRGGKHKGSVLPEGKLIVG